VSVAFCATVIRLNRFFVFKMLMIHKAMAATIMENEVANTKAARHVTEARAWELHDKTVSEFDTVTPLSSNHSSRISRSVHYRFSLNVITCLQ